MEDSKGIGRVPRSTVGRGGGVSFAGSGQAVDALGATVRVADTGDETATSRFARLFQGLNLRSRLRLMRWFVRQVRKVVVAGAMFITVLGTTAPASAASITVDGSCSLADAITAANTDAAVNGCAAGSGDDVITLPAATTLSGQLPLINSNIDFVGLAGGSTITGSGSDRLFFIGHDESTGSNGVGAPVVNFTDVTLSGGRATGTAANAGAGAGAGMGGAVFVYDGTVGFTNVTFDDNRATGGTPMSGSEGVGGGIDVPAINSGDGADGPSDSYGNGYDGGDGSYGGDGGDGGYGSYGGGYAGNGGFGGFGGDGGNGGYASWAGDAGNGGFGGGGGRGEVGSYGYYGFGGDGGFGGGGGNGFSYSYAGYGGFGGGSGYGGFGGYGGGDGYSTSGGGGGAGFGGAVFVHAGTVTLDGAIAFTDNMAVGGEGAASGTTGDDGDGRGGALFVCTQSFGAANGAASCDGEIEVDPCTLMTLTNNQVMASDPLNTSDPDAFGANLAPGVCDPCAATTVANDLFECAIALPSAVPQTTTGASNTGATVEATEPDFPINNGSRQCTGADATHSTVWFSWVAPTTGSFTIDTHGSDFDTTLQVLEGATLASLADHACNNDDARLGLAERDSKLLVTATAGTTYWIRVGGYMGDQGSVVVTIKDSDLVCLSPDDAQLSSFTSRPATIDILSSPTASSGTAGDDVIVGTPFEDLIFGAGGTDYICGFGDDDVLRGGGGGDVIVGGPGNDELLGGSGPDVIIGDAGDDEIDGQAGPDWLYGGGDADEIRGGLTADTIYGGAGDDILDGLDGADTISGGPNDDTVRSQTGPDTIYGGTGADTMFGGNGNDTIYGEDLATTGAGDGATDKCSGNLGPNDAAHAATCEQTPGVEQLF